MPATTPTNPSLHPAPSQALPTRERLHTVLNGWLVLPVAVLLLPASIALFIWSLAHGVRTVDHPHWLGFSLAILGIVGFALIIPGFFTIQPNEARVLILFGRYVGTVRASGFHWGNPFYSNGASGTTPAGTGAVSHATTTARTASANRSHTRSRISVRARNQSTEKIKVNDLRGNPIEIGAVIVWRVHDTAQAMFDVDDFEHYVSVQSESAVRHLASSYAYDDGEENEVTLRSGRDEVSHALLVELQERLGKAGVVVEETRLTHLAYAPEIAQAMLRRQQAEAVIAARQKIVHGAVSMVEMALHDLASRNILELDDERKAAMVSNLMVVLCSESAVHPVVNTGTLYT